MSKFVSFRPDTEVQAILDDIPHTKKSTFIREAIKHYVLDELPEGKPAPKGDKGLLPESATVPAPGSEESPEGEPAPKGDNRSPPAPELVEINSVKVGAARAPKSPGSEEPPEDFQEKEPFRAPTSPKNGESAPSKKPSPKPANSKDSKKTSKDSGSPSSETENTATPGLTSYLEKLQATRKQ